jgi:Flp pilus assembly protein TadD
LKLTPNNASVHHALGLTKRRKAAQLAPDHPGYTYVYRIALHSSGRQADGMVLADAHQRFGGDAEILQALATMERDRGKLDAALSYARKLVELAPDDPQAQALLRELER